MLCCHIHLSYYNEMIMYLEEKLQKLEIVVNDHGKQIKMVADGLASLTNRVDLGFTEVRKEFERVDRRFEQIDQRFEQVDQRFKQIDERFEQVDIRFEKIEKRLDRIEDQLVQFHGVLTELVTLVKNKL